MSAVSEREALTNLVAALLDAGTPLPRHLTWPVEVARRVLATPPPATPTIAWKRVRDETPPPGVWLILHRPGHWPRLVQADTGTWKLQTGFKHPQRADDRWITAPACEEDNP